MSFVQHEHMGIELRTTIGQRTDAGRVRAENQDSVAVIDPGLDTQTLAERGFLLVVADGIGGEAGGGTASRLATQRISQVYYSAPDFTNPATALARAMRTAHAEILAQAQDTPAYASMGTTAVAAVIRGNELTVVHAGDSRAYLVRGGVAQQLTHDHTWVAEQVRLGTITPEDARQHTYRHVLERFLGKEGELEPEVAGPYALQPGDVVLLCTDGLTDRVRDEELADAATRHAPQQAADALVDLANQRGGPDNVTVAVARVGNGVEPTGPAMPLPDQRTIVMPAWLVHGQVWLKQIPPWGFVLAGGIALLVILSLCCIMALIGQHPAPQARGVVFRAGSDGRATVYESPSGASPPVGSIRLGMEVVLVGRVEGTYWSDPGSGQGSSYWYRIRGRFEVYTEGGRILKPDAEGYINEVMIRKP